MENNEHLGHPDNDPAINEFVVFKRWNVSALGPDVESVP